MSYLNRPLSYFYFRFRKTNGHHILFPVCNLIIYVTLTPFEISRSFVDICPFTPKLLAFILNAISRRSPSWICNTMLLDHPQSRIGGPKKCRKFCANWVTGFRDMRIFHLRRLCLKMPISAYFGEVFGVLTSKFSRILSRPPKCTSLAGNMRFGV